VPKRYQDQVQLSAVLRAAYGPVRSEADIITATAWAQIHWWKRAEALAEAQCPPFWNAETKKARLANALGCPLAFVMIYGGKKGTPCGMPVICPFCWARDVRERWLKIDAAFFPTVVVKKRVRTIDVHGPGESASLIRSIRDTERRVRSPYDLIRRLYTFYLPAEITVQRELGWGKHRFAGFPMSGIAAWLDSRAKGWPFPAIHRVPECDALIEAAGPGGGLLEAIHFRRIADDDPEDKAAAWQVQVRQLILAPDAATVPDQLLAPHKESVEPRIFKRFSKPRRRLVVSEVARTLRYPDGLIDPHVPVERAIEYLGIRKGRRLVESYGRFRVRHT
jgi:hypothetical protein